MFRITLVRYESIVKLGPTKLYNNKQRKIAPIRICLFEYSTLFYF